MLDASVSAQEPGLRPGAVLSFLLSLLHWCEAWLGGRAHKNKTRVTTSCAGSHRSGSQSRAQILGNTLQTKLPEDHRTKPGLYLPMGLSSLRNPHACVTRQIWVPDVTLQQVELRQVGATGSSIRKRNKTKTYTEIRHLCNISACLF